MLDAMQRNTCNIHHVILLYVYSHYRSYMSTRFIGQINIETTEVLGDDVSKGKVKKWASCIVKIPKNLHLSKSALRHPNVIQYLNKKKLCTLHLSFAKGT